MVDVESQYEFTEVIGKFIKKMGFEIESTRSMTDGRTDFIAKTTNPMGGRVVSLIRASLQARLVNEADIDSLDDSMREAKAVRAAYVTTSGFSDSAVEAAKDKPISLINKYQLMDSLEKRGLTTDKELMDALDRFGMAEKHFQGQEQSFRSDKSVEDAKAYFQSKGKKNEKPVKVRLRYAPVAALKLLTTKEIYTGDQTLRRMENKDYLFVNLNNLELYYVTKKRKRSSTEYAFHRSDIVRKISDLPPEPKEHLLDLLDHGDLPIEDLEGKELSILKNNKVITVYEGKRRAGGLLEVVLEEVLETVQIVTTEIISSLATMGEGGGEVAEKKMQKTVKAEVNMPHLYGGIYDIWKYLDVEKGLNQEAEIDAIGHSSKDVAVLMKSVLGGSVKPEGLIFMPYFRAKYVDEKNEKVTKYEILVAPKFKQELVAGGEGVKVKTAPKVKARREPLAGEYRLIK